MSRLLKGKPVADAIMADLGERVRFLADRGIAPQLAIVRVGQRDDDLAYERNARKRCEAVGIATQVIALSPHCSQGEIEGVVAQVNADRAIHGCLILRPLPKSMDEKAICNLLDPAKDVDGITETSLFGVLAGTKVGFAPCTAEACLRLLDHYKVLLEGAKATVVGRSAVIGQPVAALLQQRHATVTVAHSRTRDLGDACRGADIVVAAVGRARLVGEECLSDGQTVVDVGINWDEAASALVGDVDAAAAQAFDVAISPVPGGIGAITTAVLASHVITAAETMHPHTPKEHA